MLESQAKQFTLDDKGHIFWQKNPTNPLPGEQVGYLVKGKEWIRPDIELLMEGPVVSYDRQAVKTVLESWLKAHIEEVLAPLVALKQDEEMTPAARGIAFQLYESLGVIPRGQLTELISTLDQDGRRQLRQKRVKLGPVLVFLPMLNKPASVRLRAVLWSLFNDRPLPAPVPTDGAVSVSVEGQDKVDYTFFRSISYPVYGNKAIRIDMLDRVINAVYENANEGKFQARHDMAEWLGCSIADLYAILEAMGHKKIHDPADEVSDQDSDKKEEQTEVASVEKDEPKAESVQAKAQEKEMESVEQTETAPDVEAGAEEQKETKAEKEKPELATFLLKKGQAHKRPFNKNNQNKNQGKTSRPHKGQSKRFDKRKTRDTGPKVISAGPEKDMEKSPFAVLAQLKTGDKGE